MALERIEMEPPLTADACVIWLHGLGDSGAGMSPIVPYLGLDHKHHIRFVFPDAPQQPVTINAGYVMRSWYDIKSEKLSERVDIEGIESSEKQVVQLIEEQIERGIPSHRILLVGFSQGGVLSLFTGLRYNKPLAGIVGLSCYLPGQYTLPTLISTENRQTPILQQHGIHDEVVPVDAGKSAYKTLLDAGYQTKWQDYAAAHTLLPQQLADIGAWIEDKLA